MPEAIDRFTELLAAFPDDERRDIAFAACLAVGCEFVPTGVERDENTPLGEAMIFPGRHELKQKLTSLVEEQGLREEFLIPSLYFYLTNYYRSQMESTTESIDWHLNRLSRMGMMTLFIQSLFPTMEKLRLLRGRTG